MANSKPIAIVGAGLMGHGIAQIFATQGHPVSLLDVNRDALAKALESIRANLTLMTRRGIGAAEDIEPAIERISVTQDLEEAASGAEFVIEAVSEKLELKQRVFQSLDAICPSDTVLATNTSVISITEIAEKARNKERILGTHFWNPPYLIPLVEVIPGKHTSLRAMDFAFDVLESVGKHPVRVKKDVPGFVGNRLQHALWREAISIVENDIADAATVDEVVKKGFGLRLPFLGPMENADMVGLDLTLQIHDYILRHLERSSKPSPLLERKVEVRELGFKTGVGFQEWSPERIEASRENLLHQLMGSVAHQSEE